MSHPAPDPNPSRRTQALTLLDAGRKPASVALRLGVARATIYRWWRAARRQRGEL
ncbi:helix-turn-helix domain-containing protein [Streptomyces sp. NPDC088733]|uniref:helix-turn-helix domain-containing protein n=1 Tax=Streptomyces sp. NPDC088733 TaxID=3365880 RepID=UPI00382F3044